MIQIDDSILGGLRGESRVHLKNGNVRMFANKDALRFFKESDKLFCDGTFEKKKFVEIILINSQQLT